MTEDPGRFFETLYRYCDGGSVEFRFLPSKRQSFWPLERLPQLPAFEDSQDAYFSVATRNGGGTKEHIQEIPGLWCDLDFKTTPKKEADERLMQCPCLPSCVIDSGGGYHGYWFAKEPFEKAQIPEVESILRRLATYLGADQGATDASRVLRVPGTHNLKYTPTRLVTILLLYPEREYDLSDFDLWLPEDRKNESQKTSFEIPQDGTINY